MFFNGNPHEIAAMIVMPTDAPGFYLIRSVSVMGHSGDGDRCEIQFNDCRVPATNLLGPEHGGFILAQARHVLDGSTNACVQLASQNTPLR